MIDRMIAKIWSGQSKLYWLLVPISCLYGAVVFVRRMLYRLHILKSWRAPLPIVIVGNLSVGGNGKTPLVIYLIEQLRLQGLKVGVVSRGYGGYSQHYPLMVTKETPASLVGDEPVLVYERTQIPFAVAPKRSDAVKMLLNHYALDLIITDDGLQHYALQRDIEIVVVDGKRGFGNGWLLPAGPMRESTSRLKNVDYLVINGTSQLPLDKAYTMALIPDQAINLVSGERKPVTELKSVCAMAGIGDPNRFFTMLAEMQVDLVNSISFDDHQAYSKSQLQSLANVTQTLLMTEKDAVKCKQFAQNNWWYLPIEAALPDVFISHLCQKIKKVQLAN